MRAPSDEGAESADLGGVGYGLGLLFVSLAAVWAYAPAFEFGYYADDFPLIAGAARGAAEHGAAGYLAECFDPGSASGRSQYFRPLWTASWLTDLSLGTEPGRSRAVTLALHLATAVLLGTLARLLGLGRLGGLVAAGAFACSAVPHEVVGWVCARTDALATLFLCLSLTGTLVAVRARRPLPAQALAVGALACAFLSKDSALVFPLLLLPLLLALPRLGIALRPLRVVPVLVAYAALFGLRWWAVGTPLGGAGATRRALGDLEAVLRSVVNLSSGWTWPLSELSIGSPSPTVVLGALALALALGAALWRHDRRTTEAYALGLAWAWLGLVPVLGFAQRGLGSVGTRYLHLPSLGTALAWSALLVGAGRALARGRGAPRTTLALAALLVLGSCLALRGHLRAYEPGDAMVRALVADAAELGRAHPDAAILIFDLEGAVGPVFGNPNVFPSAMGPAFEDVPSPERFHAFSEDTSRWTLEDWNAALLLLDPSVPRLVWDDAAQRIAAVDWPFTEGILRGRLEQAADGTWSCGGEPIAWRPTGEFVELFDHHEILFSQDAGEPPPLPVDFVGPYEPRLVPHPDLERAWRVRLDPSSTSLVLLIGSERTLLPFGPAGAVQVREPKVLVRAADPEAVWHEVLVPEGGLGTGAWLQVLLPTDDGVALTECMWVPPVGG